MAGEDAQVVTGRVRHEDGGVVVAVDPIRIGPDGTASAIVEFDQPLQIPISAVFRDPERAAEFERGVSAVLECTSTRIDEIARAGGLDPARDLAGADLKGVDFGGTAEDPMDLRGWDLSGCSLVGCTFDHVIVDETTDLSGADLADAKGPCLPAILALAGRSRPAP